MKRFLFACIGLFAVSSITLFATQLRKSILITGDPVKGKVLIQRKGCLKCHTVWGVGEKHAPDIVNVARGKSIAELTASLWSHSPNMFLQRFKRRRDIPKFNSRELEDLFSFIYYLNFLDLPGSVEDGEKVFREKRCLQCHKVGRVGKRVGPSLDEFGGYMSPILLSQEMWNHAGKMHRKMKAKSIPTPSLSGKDMADILAFVRSSAVKRNKITYLQPGDAGKGRRLFSRKCAKCHAVWGVGGKKAPDLGKKRITGRAAEIASVMWNHGNKMLGLAGKSGVKYPLLSDNEMADILAYVYSLSFSSAPGDARRGRKVVASKCRLCHTVKDRSKEGKALRKVDNAFALGALLWNHKRVADRAEKETQWKVLTGRDIGDILSYLRSIEE